MRLSEGIAAAVMMLAPADGATPAEKWRVAPVARSRAIGVAYARCAVRQNRKAVVVYLADPVGTDDPAKLASALPPKCLNRAVGGVAVGPSQLHFSALLARGLLFEALYMQEAGKHPEARALAHVSPQRYDVAGVDAVGQTLRHDYRALMKIGDCAARAAPERVQALLSTVAASKGEERAIAELRAAWTHCLPGKRDLQFSAEMTRATVVEPFYRLSHALEAPSPQGGS